VQAMAAQLAKKVLPRSWWRKTLIGAVIGAGFGLIYSIVVTDQASTGGMYLPQTTIGMFVARFVSLLPWALIGAAMGFFSGIAMSKTSKMLIGAAVGVGIGLVSLLFIASLGAVPKPTTGGLGRHRPRLFSSVGTNLGCNWFLLWATAYPDFQNAYWCGDWCLRRLYLRIDDWIDTLCIPPAQERKKWG